MTTNPKKSQIPLDTITHISADIARAMNAYAAADPRGRTASV